MAEEAKLKIEEESVQLHRQRRNRGADIDTKSLLTVSNESYLLYSIKTAAIANRALKIVLQSVQNQCTSLSDGQCAKSLEAGRQKGGFSS